MTYNFCSKQNCWSKGMRILNFDYYYQISLQSIPSYTITQKYTAIVVSIIKLLFNFTSFCYL